MGVLGLENYPPNGFFWHLKPEKLRSWTLRVLHLITKHCGSRARKLYVLGIGLGHSINLKEKAGALSPYGENLYARDRLADL